MTKQFEYMAVTPTAETNLTLDYLNMLGGLGWQVASVFATAEGTTAILMREKVATQPAGDILVQPVIVEAELC